MIYTVTVNPSLDLDITSDEIIAPTTFRATAALHAGGKGIDVSRVLGTLGAKSIATGFLGGANGDTLERLATADGLQLDFLRIAQETRTNIIINAPTNAAQKAAGVRQDHRFVFPGPDICPCEASDLLAKLGALSTAPEDLKPTSVAICGSLSANLAPDYYAVIISLFKDTGARVFLDTSPPALRNAANSVPAPDVVKPNLHEFDGLMGGRLLDGFRRELTSGEPEERFLERKCGAVWDGDQSFWRVLLAEVSGFFRGHPRVRALLLTFGEHGMALALQNGSVTRARFSLERLRHRLHGQSADDVATLRFVVRSTLTAGDATLAGLIWALEQGKSWSTALKVAVGAGSAAVTEKGTTAPSQRKILAYSECVETVEEWLPGYETGERLRCGGPP